MSEPLYQVKLLSALRTGDPALIHPFLAGIANDRRASRESQSDLGAAALHLAIRCASVDTVSLLLSHRSISPNAIHPPVSGTTALHLAASLGRADVVNLLLEQDTIDDTLRDSNGRSCTDVARGKDVLSVINDSRALLTASYRSLLRTYILSSRDAPPSPSLLSLLSSPRAKLVNLSYLDDASGTTLLHEATRRKDIRLVELAVRAGADVFVRDRRGRPAQEVVGKDDKMRVFLRQFANNDTTLITDNLIIGPPTLKGYLNKYTNVARGYSTRWFVLKDGVLSYYRHQEDEQVASRGSISMKTAVLRPPTGAEKLRFEVHSTPSRGHTSVQKWYMKANHPVEASRWTQAISRAVEHAKHQYKPNEGDTSPISRYSGRGSISSTLSIPHTRKNDRDAESVSSSAVPTDDEGGEVPVHGVPSSLDMGHDDRQDAASGKDSTDRNLEGDHPPHESFFELQGNSTAAQLELTTQLLAEQSSPSISANRTIELNGALKESLGTVQSMLNDYLYMAKERDDWWRARFVREQERQMVWEQSLQSVVEEGEALERELRRHSRRHSRIDPSIAGGEGMGTVKVRPSALPLPPTIEGEPEFRELTPDTAVPIPITPAGRRQTSPDSAKAGANYGSITGRAFPSSSPVARRITMQRQSSVSASGVARSSEEGDAIDTDEEDEFFDAIESNALPNLVVHEALTGHSEPMLSEDIDKGQYEGYRVLRKELDLKSDNRPPTSLWSVLKHSIGKDLTRISFPVFFNEPTSMLQRMAEDMEFSECLDAAFGERDPLRRIAFVAAFAMSNYSSTIGRIAKPFNPMLSETFEYVRLDKEYRYLSEQVSHHPPISACWAEGPRWRYYGEVDAQNRFTGKSFEIRPTGVANVDILLPVEWGPTLPKYQSKYTVSERALEHYSWKKVTTNVSGFILGSPTIDHYGEMVITNHRTKDQCLLTFKPRGWRGKDAYEISGYVADAAGNIAYEIAGRWNSQLIMRPVGTGSGSLNPDQTIRGPNSPSTQEFILLWRNSEKPPAPFNLTPFAISLNNLPEDTLRPYLPPTDCRLRPDQRAFELGRYEHANTLKSSQEDHQRATRKARDDGHLPPHRPQWFSAETDGDTGERVWTPLRIGEDVAYWVEREKAYLGTGKEAWPDVDRIFIDDNLR